jgi:general secretion pathway protein G
MHVQSYPSTAEGLGALVQPIADIPGWAGPYLDKQQVPLDPWNNPYQYELVNLDLYRVWSFGPDGVDGTDDDLSSQF